MCYQGHLSQDSAILHKFCQILEYFWFFRCRLEFSPLCRFECEGSIYKNNDLKSARVSSLYFATFCVNSSMSEHSGCHITFEESVLAFHVLTF